MQKRTGYGFTLAHAAAGADAALRSLRFLFRATLRGCLTFQFSFPLAFPQNRQNLVPGGRASRHLAEQYEQVFTRQ